MTDRNVDIENDVVGKITAGELREIGIPVPDTIPDVASIERAAVQIAPGDPVRDGDKIRMKLNVSFSKPFEWIDLRIEPGTFENDDVKMEVEHVTGARGDLFNEAGELVAKDVEIAPFVKVKIEAKS